MFKKKFPRFWTSILIVMLILLSCCSGCSSAATAAQQDKASKQQAAADQSGTSARQPAQPRDGKGNELNPAVQAAMDILRLQKSTDAALTSEQKSTLKPILTELINATDPDSTYLQEKAEAIRAVFTDTQKSFLTNKQKPQDARQGDRTPPAGNPDPPAGTPPPGIMLP
jgi:hypothetical protein